MKINADGTEILTDSLFGIPLVAATFDTSGKLESLSLLEINVTALFELLQESNASTESGSLGSANPDGYLTTAARTPRGEFHYSLSQRSESAYRG